MAITPKQAYEIHYREVDPDGKPAPFDDLSDMAADSAGIEADLLNQVFTEDEAAARTFTEECLVVAGFKTDDIARWWDQSRVELGGQSPREVWDADRFAVIDLAITEIGPMQ